MRGNYQHCAEKNLHRYLAEFEFRYSTRAMTDGERAALAVKGGERQAPHVSSTSLSRILNTWLCAFCAGVTRNQRTAEIHKLHLAARAQTLMPLR